MKKAQQVVINDYVLKNYSKMTTTNTCGDVKNRTLNTLTIKMMNKIRVSSYNRCQKKK